jgi:hypothetical protein
MVSLFYWQQAIGSFTLHAVFPQKRSTWAVVKAWLLISTAVPTHFWSPVPYE